MKQIPRYDPNHVDPLSLKPVLSNLFNSTLVEEWMASPFKQQLFVGNHMIECAGAIKESRYRETKTGKFDGIHLLGSSGRKAYTESVINILRAANMTAPEYEEHLTCQQARYQSRKKFVKPSPSRQIIFTIPTSNRFQSLYHGNW